MSGLISITVSEARGFVAVSAEIDNLAVFLGCSSAGSGLSPFFLSGDAAVASVGYGDAVDALTQTIEQRQSDGSVAAKVPAALYTLPADTAGSYGTIDVSGITGTGIVEVDSTVIPLGTFEAQIKIVGGGLIGTAGITYRSTLDGGRNWSNVTALGTAVGITIPNSGVAFELEPPTATLVAAVNDAKAKYNLHVVKIAGGVHGAADNADVTAVSNAVTDDDCIPLINDICTKYELHRVKTAGAVHGLADSTNALVITSAATTVEGALARYLDFKAKYNAHVILTTGAVHGASDAADQLVIATPSSGTLLANDLWKVRTLGPAPSTASVDAAFIALANSTADFGLVVCEFPADAAMAAHFTTGLNALLARGKRCAVIGRTRLPDFEAAESETTWGTAIEANFSTFQDSRVHIRATYDLTTDAMTTRQYRRSDLAQFAADCVRVARFVWPCAPNDRATPNASLVYSDGSDAGHDEGPRGAFTGLSDDTLGNKFGAQQRLADPTRREDVYNTVPWVFYAADERIRNLPTRRLCNAIERVAVSAGIPSAGVQLFYIPAGPGAGTLTPESQLAIQEAIYQALHANFKGEIQNIDDSAVDSGLVQVTPAITVSGGNLLGVSVTLAPVIGGFVQTLKISLAIQE